MKILIVDDHPLIREALRQVLTALDKELTLLEAQTCAEALSMADRNPDLDLVLLDLGLPDAAGSDALTQMRERFPSIPVVVLSASEEPRVVTSAIDAGAMGFIPKTASNQVLLNALRLVLAGGVYLPREVLLHGAGNSRTGTEAAAGPRAEDIRLTARQRDVLALLVQGKPNKLICRALHLAEGTVKIHVTAILKALNVSNRTQAVIAVSRLGLKLPRA